MTALELMALLSCPDRNCLPFQRARLFLPTASVHALSPRCAPLLYDTRPTTPACLSAFVTSTCSRTMDVPSTLSPTVTPSIWPRPRPPLLVPSRRTPLTPSSPLYSHPPWRVTSTSTSFVELTSRRSMSRRWRVLSMHEKNAPLCSPTGPWAPGRRSSSKSPSPVHPARARCHMEWLPVIRQCFVPATCLTTQKLWWTGRSFGRCAEYPPPSKAVTSWASWSTRKGRSSSATTAPMWACKCAWITRAHSGCSLVYTGLWLSWGFWVSIKWPQTTLELINFKCNYFGTLVPEILL